MFISIISDSDSVESIGINDLIGVLGHQSWTKTAKNEIFNFYQEILTEDPLKGQRSLLPRSTDLNFYNLTWGNQK